MKKLFTSITLLLLVSCSVSNGRKVNFNYKDSIVKNKTTEADVKRKFGKPVNIQNFGNGLTVLEYSYSSADSFGNASAELLFIHIKNGIAVDYQYTKSNY